MLEKAISYVKFLQLQVKVIHQIKLLFILLYIIEKSIICIVFFMQVLATDEFWPAQGGKAPEVSHVKEAIDAILSSHRERNSTYKL